MGVTAVTDERESLPATTNAETGEIQSRFTLVFFFIRSVASLH